MGYYFFMMTLLNGEHLQNHKNPFTMTARGMQLQKVANSGDETVYKRRS
jgi:hypothetical protein